jgi:hypothetical protein
MMRTVAACLLLVTVIVAHTDDTVLATEAVVPEHEFIEYREETPPPEVLKVLQDDALMIASEKMPPLQEVEATLMQVSNPCTESEKQGFLTAINKKRAEHGACPLKWSDDLAATVQDVYGSHSGGMPNHAHGSKSCYSVPKSKGGPAGENIAWGAMTLSPFKATQVWYNEIKACGAFPGCTDGARGTVGHFTALVWKTASTLGCAYTADKKGVICRFGTPNSKQSWGCTGPTAPNMSNRGCYKHNVLAKGTSPPKSCAAAAAAAEAATPPPTPAPPKRSGKGGNYGGKGGKYGGKGGKYGGKGGRRHYGRHYGRHYDQPSRRKHTRRGYTPAKRGGCRNHFMLCSTLSRDCAKSVRIQKACCKTCKQYKQIMGGTPKKKVCEDGSRCDQWSRRLFSRFCDMSRMLRKHCPKSCGECK